MCKNKTIKQNINVYYVMYPLYVASKIFGLAPYTYMRSKSTVQWKITKFGITQTSLYTILCILSLIPVFQYQIRCLTTEQTDVISIYSDIFRTENGILLALCKLFTTLIYKNDYCLFLDKLIDFDRDVKQLGIQVDNNVIFKNIMRFTIFIYVIIFAVGCVDFVMFSFSKDLLTHLYWASCFFTFFIIVTGTFQFLCFIYIVYKRFVTLNKFISTMVNLDIEIEDKMTDSWIFRKNTNKVFDISIIGKHVSRVKHISVLSQNNRQINKLSEMHDTLCSLSKSVNSMYSLHILLITSTTFVVLVTQLYFFYLMLSSNDNYQLTLTKLWSVVIWGILFFVMLYTITLACSKIKDEADSSSVLLHKLDIDDEDNSTRTSVEMFSLQMLHQKVEFTACGFFPVDFSVLYMIIGAVTTYLVFLIQFEMASRTVSDLVPGSQAKKT